MKMVMMTDDGSDNDNVNVVFWVGGNVTAVTPVV
jgi:hypothetical protein